jgi:chromosome segregation ATPase
MDNGGEWCTYVQAAKRLHKSHGAIRQMALRGQLQRVRGNDGRARVLVVPDMERAAHERAEHALDEQPERAAHVQRMHGALVTALESHIKTLQSENEALKQDLAATRVNLSAQVETLQAQLAGVAEGKASEEANNALREHNATLKADVDKLEAQLAAERERTEKAIAAFAALADRLDALAAERERRPWWRRLVG